MSSNLTDEQADKLADDGVRFIEQLMSSCGKNYGMTGKLTTELTIVGAMSLVKAGVTPEEFLSSTKRVYEALSEGVVVEEGLAAEVLQTPWPWPKGMAKPDVKSLWPFPTKLKK